MWVDICTDSFFHYQLWKVERDGFLPQVAVVMRFNNTIIVFCLPRISFSKLASLLQIEHSASKNYNESPK
jgi:hypothetical protein